MNAFVGEWNAGIEDFTNLQAYSEAIGQPDVYEACKAGVETTIAKEGSAYVITSVQGMVDTMREMLNADGSVKVESEMIPSDAVKVKHRTEGGKLIVEGTMGGAPTKSTRWIQGEKLHIETTTAGVTTKAVFSKGTGASW